MRWYRLEPCFRGWRYVRRPRRPYDPMPGETRLARTCVAPSPLQAWLAVRNACYRVRCWHVYVLDEPVDVVPAFQVPDAARTGEHWILHDATFRWAGIMDERWMELYLLELKMPRSHRAIERSKQVLEAFLKQCDRCYVAFSGGKDSSALLALLAEMGCTDVPVFTQADDLDWPDKRSHCARVVEHLGFQDWTLLPSLRSARAQLSFEAEAVRGTFSHVVVQYVQMRDMHGVIMGLRAEESKGRRINYARKGSIYEAKGRITCQPIAHWSGPLVMGYLLARGVPLHPLYTARWSVPPHERRMSWIVNPRFLGEGQLTFLKHCFPVVYERLIANHPELCAMA